ncbi:MAG TPA: MerR family transcriptional regulator [Kofleriaceae bacterium]
MAFTVGELAKLTGITVRTLHHYDEIGLVQPSARSDAGYRLYGEADVRKLQRVLVYRELGLPLDEIAGVIESADARAVLEKHREMLIEKRARLDAMIRSLDAALRHEGDTMSATDVTEMFDGFDEHADEAKARWGDTPAYAESARRTKHYGPTEWEAIKREGEAVYQRFAELLHEGAPPSDARVQGVVAAHRAHIDRWFYPCSIAMQRNLAALYVGDPRFAANLDKIAPGLAAFVHAAITG